MIIPKPKDLANAIAHNSLTMEAKRQILANLQYMSEAQILHLYLTLKDLQKAESEFLKQVERVDLKYKIKVENEINKALKNS